MFIVYFKKRKATAQKEVCFYNGAGRSIILPLGEPKEIPDKFGYKILGENSDIVRRVEEPQKADPQKEAKKKTKKRKVVEEYTTA